MNILDLDSYHDFSEGVQLDEKEKKDFIFQCVANLKLKLGSNPKLDEAFTTISTGNFKVFGEIYRTSENEPDTIVISITENYKSKSFFN